VTNALGLAIAEWRMALLDDGYAQKGTTLGAYRRGKHMPWIPGATIDVWFPCARGWIPGPDGKMIPHCYFITTLGGTDEGDRSIVCPSCRAELASARVPAAAATPARSSSPQADLF